MRSNYKKLGDYIRPIHKFNDGMEVKELLGISNNKYFQRSHTNLIGIDLQTYRVVRTGQFAYNRATTRNGDKISIALRNGNDCIVSPSYRIFEVIDENLLDSEYLMMWFRRPEFDRYARFMSHGSAHEFFEWEQMSAVELPIPHIDKQREIVNEYNTIVNRINLNSQLIKKLEETALAIYRNWFVDFEFPDAEGKPFKSNGGEMEFNEELHKEIPKGWKAGTLEDIAFQYMGYAFKGDQYVNDEGISVLRGENVSERFLRWDNHKKWNEEILPRMEKCYLKEYDIVIGMDGSKVGRNWAMVSKYDLPLLLAQRVSSVRAKSKEYQNFIFYSMCVLDFNNYVSQVQTGTSIPHISGKQIFDFPIVVGEQSVINYFDRFISKTVTHKLNLNSENQKLDVFKGLLLSKLATIEGKVTQLIEYA